MTVRAHENRSYSIERRTLDGKPKVWCVVACGRCPATERIHMATDTGPESVMAALRKRRWHVDGRNAVVAKVRDQAGLKLKGDPRLTALRADLDSVKEMVNEIATRIAALEQR